MNRNSLVRRPFGYSNHNLALWLVAINVLVFAMGKYIFSGFQGLLFGYRTIGTDIYLVMTPGVVLLGGLWQFLTYMFVHADFSHLIVNMLGLFFFGTQVEREMGSKEFILYYLLTGMLAGLFSFLSYVLVGSYNVRLLGASGAIFAVLLAFATIHPEAQIYIWGLVPIRAPIMVLGYTAIEIFSQVFSFRSNVAHLTHLAGFGFGWLYFLVRFGINPAKRFFNRR